MRRVSHLRTLAVLHTAAIAIATTMGCSAATAQTGGLLDALFGGFRPAPPPATPIPPPVTSSSAPAASITVTPMWRGGSGGSVAHCVRLCDGGHFPLPRIAASSATPAKLCNALCPGTRTRVYWGSQIDRAVAANGMTYASLDTAFKYRRERPGDCTCNGRDVFGTAAISFYADVTLRPGDIAVTDNGLRVFVGSQADRHQPGDFTPIANDRSLPPPMRAYLETVRVASPPGAAPESMTFNARIIFGFEPLRSESVTFESAPSQR